MTNNRKGIILAGGTGSRLYPLTIATSKQLMPVYDKPMIYYPLSVLMISKIQDIAVISTKEYLESFKRLLGDGSKFGVNLSYFVQNEPNGIAESFIITERFFKGHPVCLILGDNIFHMKISTLNNCKKVNGGIVFGYHVHDPERYGVVEFDNQFKVVSIEEKPKKSKSNYAIPGLYYYDNSVIEFAKNIKPSKRGEYEITDLNKKYLSINKLQVNLLERGSVWLDTGTFQSLMQANQYVQVIEERQGRKIGCIEEAAFRMNLIDAEHLIKIAQPLLKSGYGQYLLSLIKI